mmetsp:Transcript_5588/g.17854  ORF Transcript_5588/g.17854 Transcript_5588/m.17854 type:complete len:183 (+) Transcript_5588:4312-4860(+)
MVSFLFRNSQYMKKNFSKIFSHCEYNHSNDKCVKSDIDFFDMSFQKNLFGKPKQLFFIDFSKKKKLCMTYINLMNNIKINKIKNISSEKKLKYKQLFESDANFFGQKNKLYFSEINFFFVYKSKHQGCIEKKLNIFVNNNTIVRLTTSKERFVFFFRNLQKKKRAKSSEMGLFFDSKKKNLF